eukprot:Amastigsp_a509955_118.p3 type:complete len:113 gc:universal Amastigsp_a509955_118:607-945(+)
MSASRRATSKAPSCSSTSRTTTTRSTSGRSAACLLALSSRKSRSSRAQTTTTNWYGSPKFLAQTRSTSTSASTSWCSNLLTTGSLPLRPASRGRDSKPPRTQTWSPRTPWTC